MSVLVARIIPSRVRKLRSLLFRKESTAMRPASQKDALGRRFRRATCSPYLVHYVRRATNVPVISVG